MFPRLGMIFSSRQARPAGGLESALMCALWGGPASGAGYHLAGGSRDPGPGF